ncbi:hypothetical protein [Thalassospira alkalitolerans]|uniref:hypothetical protein n=1 Tax=Thalassospira alkalitolerans TaxID=1293890 RepID=UPI003AA89DF6
MNHSLFNVISESDFKQLTGNLNRGLQKHGVNIGHAKVGGILAQSLGFSHAAQAKAALPSVSSFPALTDEGHKGEVEHDDPYSVPALRDRLSDLEEKANHFANGPAQAEQDAYWKSLHEKRDGSDRDKDPLPSSSDLEHTARSDELISETIPSIKTKIDQLDKATKQCDTLTGEVWEGIDEGFSELEDIGGLSENDDIKDFDDFDDFDDDIDEEE